MNKWCQAPFIPQTSGEKRHFTGPGTQGFTLWQEFQVSTNHLDNKEILLLRPKDLEEAGNKQTNSKIHAD